jgi:DNA replication protein DnaC
MVGERGFEPPTPWSRTKRSQNLNALSGDQIGDPTIADGILDRLVHNAHRIEMRGESMRKKRNPTRDESEEK